MNLKEAIPVEKNEDYVRFIASLTPGVDPSSILGIRIPLLRKLAKEMARNGEMYPFLDELPHQYFEENILHAVLLSHIKDADECKRRVEAFLPYIDNWSVSDTVKLPALAKKTDRFLAKVYTWVSSNEVYTCRVGVKMLMDYFLDENFKPEILVPPSKIRSSEYYVNMMIAWFYATALAKRWDETIPYIEQRKLPTWVHQKTIQKAIESFRVTQEHKDYLKTLK